LLVSLHKLKLEKGSCSLPPAGHTTVTCNATRNKLHRNGEKKHRRQCKVSKLMQHHDYHNN